MLKPESRNGLRKEYVAQPGLYLARPVHDAVQALAIEKCQTPNDVISDLLTKAVEQRIRRDDGT